MALLAEIKNGTIYLEANDKKEIEELMVFLIRNYARIEKRGYLEGGQVTILDFRENVT